MPDTKNCAECGAPLPAYWPKGLCPQCALDGALDMSHGESQVLQPEEIAAAAGLLPPPPNGESAPLGTFGEYDLLEEIARGGMGIVYKARHRSLNRIVAIKMILAGSLAGREFVQRFRTEASAAAILQHQNIVAIHDVGVHQGQHYFSMDYVEGQTLAQLVGQQPLPANRAARYVELIAAAIHYAHERGILHRDLKPSNVLIDSNDQPRITDFGLAKRLDGESSLTLSGQVLGSPNFMPPEQAGGKGGNVGRPSDVYALGGILYYLLTARAPFHAESLEHIIAQVLHAEPVPPRLLNPSIPRDLETITLKCLEKEPSRRYQTAKELADELGRVLRHEPIQARPVNTPEKLWRWCRRKPALASSLGLAGAALLVGFATTSWQWHRAEQQQLATQHQLYVANMNLAQAAWEQNNVTLVRQLLKETATSPERGFEWYYWQRQLHLELKTLRGHTGSVLAVAYSPDGQRIVTGSADHTARVWDAANGKGILTLRGHDGPVSSVAFSSNGRRIVTGSWDKTAKVWDSTNGTRLLTLSGHTNRVFSVAISPDGQSIVTGSVDQTAKVWDANSGNEIFPLNGHTDGVWAVAFSPDGQRIVTASWDGTARVWATTNGSELAKFTKHGDSVVSVAFSPDSQRIVTGGRDNTARVWDAANGRELFSLEGHSAPVVSVTFSPDGRRIATAGNDQTARVWDAGGRKEWLAIKRHGSRISSVAFSPDSERIVTGGGSVNIGAKGELINIGRGDKTAKIWKASNDEEPLTLKGHTDLVLSVALSRDGQRIVTSSFDKTARVWEASTGKVLRILEGHSDAVQSVAFSPDGRRIVTGSWDKTAKVWDADTGRELFSLKGHSNFILSVAVSPDSQWIATGAQDQVAKVWDATNGKEQRTLRGHSGYKGFDGWIWSVAFSPDGLRIVTSNSGEDYTVTVWEAASGKEVITIRGPSSSWMVSAAFSPDGSRIVTGSADTTAKVWDAATGANLLTLTGHSDQLLPASFSPDGQRIATGSLDQTAKLWDAATGKELLTFKGHRGWVFSVAFSPDGQRIATASGDHTVRVWEAASKEQVAQWQEEERTAEAVKQAPANPR